MNQMYKFVVNRNVQKNDCAMFDIDDTLIYSKDSTLNRPVYDLLMFTRSLGYKVIIITARPAVPQIIRYTINQLNAFNIKYDMLFFCEAHKKTLCKKRLKDHHFVISVGDQLTDLTDSESYLMTRGK